MFFVHSHGFVLLDPRRNQRLPTTSHCLREALWYCRERQCGRQALLNCQLSIVRNSIGFLPYFLDKRVLGMVAVAEGSIGAGVKGKGGGVAGVLWSLWKSSWIGQVGFDQILGFVECCESLFQQS